MNAAGWCACIVKTTKMRRNFILFLLVGAVSALAARSHATGRGVSKLRSPSGHQREGSSLLHMTAASSTASPNKTRGEATVSSSTFNLAKSIIGAGVLSLPSGISFFADVPSAILPASIMCAVMGLVSAYTFSLIGRVCEKTGATSFQDAWGKTIDPKSAWTISAGITAMCFLASLAYSIIIGDSFTSLATSFNLPRLLAERSNVILLITTFVLFPLCSLKSLNSLSPFSLLGLGGTLYTALFMVIRYLDGSYAAKGKFFAALAPALKPSFHQRGGYSVNHLTFVLISMLSTSYIAHYNAPKFYVELKDASMPRFNKVVTYAFGASIATFILMMNIGFLTFGGATSGFVLNNYAGSDSLASFARLAIGLALLTGYPFTFSALRDGILDLAKLKGDDRTSKMRPLTIGLITVITSLALALKDVGYVVSLSGALFGSVLMFVVPAIMNISSLKASTKTSGKELSRGSKMEIVVNYLMISTGIVMGGLGVAISTLRQMKKL